jgi:tRNA A-37 threonylcarbamoyl transferase component Bud32
MPPRKNNSKCLDKKCPVGKVCNPDTGRCINIKKAISRKTSKGASKKNKCIDKKCPVGKVCNPDTGRCVNIKKAVSKKTSKVASKKNKCIDKKCPVGKVCNPDTGRCVNIKKAISRKTSKVASKKDKCIDKKCPIEKLCNPETGRCKKKTREVLRTLSAMIDEKEYKSVGIIPKSKSLQLGQEAIPAPSGRVSEAINKLDITGIGNNITKLPSGTDIKTYIDFKYKENKLLGEGRYGSVYIFKTPTGEERVVKLSQIKNSYEIFNTIREIFIQEIFYRMNLAPKIYSTEIIINYPFYNIPQRHILIEMEKIDGNVEDLLNSREFAPSVIENIMKEILTMVSIYQQNNYIHGDLHWQNIGYNYINQNSIRLYLIDYGLSCCVTRDLTKDKDPTLLDITQLVRTSIHLTKNVTEVRKWLAIIYNQIVEETNQQGRGQQFIGFDQLKAMKNKIDSDTGRSNLDLYDDLFMEIFRQAYESYLNIDNKKVKQNINEKQPIDLNIPTNIKKYNPGIITLK